MTRDAVEKALQDQYKLLSLHLDECGKRLLLGSIATVLRDAKKGGISKASDLTGAARQTISRGMSEVNSQPVAEMAGRTRLPGGGAKTSGSCSAGFKRRRIS